MKGAERRTGFSPSVSEDGGLEPALRSKNVITEASPLPSFETAAGYFGYAEEVPPEVRASLHGAPLYLRYKIRP
jgi:hypothetical protein